jgi:hypothetical protein
MLLLITTLMLLSTPDYTGWGATKWQMAPTDVQRAAGGELKAIAIPTQVDGRARKFVIERVSVTDDLYGKLFFEFYEDKLDAVAFELEGDKPRVFAQVMSALQQQYGAPRDAGTTSAIWSLPSSSIMVEALRSSRCVTLRFSSH